MTCSSLICQFKLSIPTWCAIKHFEFSHTRCKFRFKGSFLSWIIDWGMAVGRNIGGEKGRQKTCLKSLQPEVLHVFAVANKFISYEVRSRRYKMERSSRKKNIHYPWYLQLIRVSAFSDLMVSEKIFWWHSEMSPAALSSFLQLLFLYVHEGFRRIYHCGRVFTELSRFKAWFT